MENTENYTLKVKDFVAHYEQQGKLNNPKTVKNDLNYLAEKPLSKSIKELATYFNSTAEEIKKDSQQIGNAKQEKNSADIKQIPFSDTKDITNDRNQNGIKDSREHDVNSNRIPDRKERDLNQNGIADKNEKPSLADLKTQFLEIPKPGDGLKIKDQKDSFEIYNVRPGENGKIYYNSKNTGEEFNMPTSDFKARIKTGELSLEKQNNIDIAQPKAVLSKPEINQNLKEIFGENTKFRAEQIPFNDFKTHLGLNEKQVLEKGKPFLESLLNGNRTEMQSLKITSVNDMEVKGRLSIKDDKLYIHPLQPELKPGEKLKINGFKEMDLTKAELSKLNSGDAISKNTIKENGSKEVLFIQKDKQNNEILSLPQNFLRSPDKVGNKVLSIEQKEQVSKGKELTLQDPERGNSKVKIDLTSNKGFSVYNEQGLKENKTIDFYKKEFGVSNKENRTFSREKATSPDRVIKPDNQRSRGNNNFRAR